MCNLITGKKQVISPKECLYSTKKVINNIEHCEKVCQTNLLDGFINDGLNNTELGSI